MTYEQILAKVKELIAQYPLTTTLRWLIVVTGGEPMLQKNLIHFCEQALDKYDVQIETNGMYHLDLPDETTVVMSPKVGGAKAKKYPKPNQHMLDRADHLKFVLEADPASTYHTVPDYAWKFPRTVWVSPMAVYKRPMSAAEGERASAWDATLIDQPATAANYVYASGYALKHGLRCSIQQHLFYAMP
jgi:organic radical activating enzyme